MSSDMEDLKRRMEGSITALNAEFAGLRTGRASVGMVEPVTVDAYGSQMPLNQVANISVPEARMLSIQVWDKGMVKAVEKAVREAGLGLNPVVDGQLVRVPVPELSEERRKELTKIAAKYAENARIAVRNIRRDGMEHVKKLEKEKEISEDEMHSRTDEIQKLTDSYIKKIDELLSAKEKDILNV